ncbi:MAG: hypothetical protein KDA75_05590 [Planctomycetaceae bacterium]|nr:hypothetical protein [Planctomycetaceae bacterium]
MKVAILGDDPQLDPWPSRIVACGAEPVDLRRQPPPNEGVPSDSNCLDAAILGGSSTSIREAARVVGAQTPLLVLPRVTDVAAIAYGLLPDLEDGRRIIPALSARHAAAVQAYLQRFIRGDLGDLTLIEVTRTQPAEQSSTGAARLQHAVIEAAFFQDVDLLRLLGGDYNRVTAVRVGGDDAHARQLSVTLSADDLADAVWTITPGPESGWRMTLTGTRATAELRSQDGDSPTFQIDGQNIVIADTGAEIVALQAFLDTLDSVDQQSSQSTELAGWNDLIRAVDLLEGVNRSLRRRRTIDLHFESTSERSQFKTQMTTIGCGVLLWALFGTCLGLILGSAFDPRDSTERRAAAAGTILHRDDFVEFGAELTPLSAERLLRNVAVDGEASIVLIEREVEETARGIDSDRLSTVQDVLREQSGLKAPPQMEVRALAGGWFRRAMIGYWVATFGPLLVFLAVQTLFPLTRAVSVAGAETD